MECPSELTPRITPLCFLSKNKPIPCVRKILINDNNIKKDNGAKLL